MRKRLDEVFAEVEYDNLIYDSYPPAVVFGVKLAAGQGLLKRGTLLSLNNGIMEMIGAASAGKANAVLAEPADTGEPSVKTQAEPESEGAEEETEAVMGIAYRTGHFNTNCLITEDGYQITEADKEALRSVGILISTAFEI